MGEGPHPGYRKCARKGLKDVGCTGELHQRHDSPWNPGNEHLDQRLGGCRGKEKEKNP